LEAALALNAGRVDADAWNDDPAGDTRSAVWFSEEDGVGLVEMIVASARAIDGVHLLIGEQKFPSGDLPEAALE
jgi:hypothetical protein